jgi:putative flippase GtrA
MHVSNSAFRRAANNGFVRFLLVGIVNTLIGLTVTFVCLNVLGLHYWLSTLLGNVIGAINSYLLNKSFTFRSKASVRATLWKFMTVTAVCYVIAFGLASIAAEQLIPLLNPAAGMRVQDNLAALAGSGLYTTMNYFGQKRITFRPQTEIREVSNEK